jgi:hypothetical protein
VKGNELRIRQTFSLSTKLAVSADLPARAESWVIWDEMRNFGGSVLEEFWQTCKT